MEYLIGLVTTLIILIIYRNIDRTRELEEKEVKR